MANFQIFMQEKIGKEMLDKFWEPWSAHWLLPQTNSYKPTLLFPEHKENRPRKQLQTYKIIKQNSHIQTKNLLMKSEKHWMLLL